MLQRVLAACPIVVLALGCASPTLPLPPPLLPSVSAGPDADHIKLTATCNYPERFATIVVTNENPSVSPDLAVGGAIADKCGAWSTTVYAHRGDPLVIIYLVNGTDVSQPASITP